MSLIVNPFTLHPGITTPIALVAHTKATADMGGGITTPAINTTGASLTVIYVAYLGSTPPTAITDSKGNTYVLIQAYSGGNGAGALYYCKNPTVGSGHTFTSATGGVNNYSSMCVAAFSGTDTTANYDVQNGAGSASATTQQPGSVTPSVNNEVVVTGLSFIDTGLAGNATINGGFTVTDSRSDAGNFSVAMAYLVQTTKTAANPTWTSPAAADRMIAAIASFKHS